MNPITPTEARNISLLSQSEKNLEAFYMAVRTAAGRGDLKVVISLSQTMVEKVKSMGYTVKMAEARYQIAHFLYEVSW